MGRNLETLIFTATTGRSGTKTLTRIFSVIENCASYHESQPIMNGELMINRDFFDDPRTRFVYKYVKSLNIRRFAKGGRYYFEGNHEFIKSFHDYVIDDFQGKVKVIHLYRNPVKMANSLFTINNHPGTTEGNKWWLNYNSPNNLIRIAHILNRDKDFTHDFYKCLWYWYEIEARVAFWRQHYKEVPFIDFRTEDISNGEKLITQIQR